MWVLHFFVRCIIGFSTHNGFGFHPSPLTSPTRLQKEGHDSDPDPILLNPAHALVGTWGKYKNTANALADWMVREDGGQKVVSGFMANGVVLYTKAPKGEERR